MPFTRTLPRDRKLPLFTSIGKILPTFLAKIKTVPQTILLVVFGFSLLFGGQVINAAAGSSDFSWNLIRNSDGQTACTIQVTHDGEPTLDEITQTCGSDLATGWQNGEYSFVQITPTPVPTATVVTKSWLETPATAAGLQTNRPLAYLAGKLIAAGYVDVSSCNGSALLVNGYASPCGLTAAMPYVYV